MTNPTSGRLRVNGATLHYQVRGHGALLLLIPGGTVGAASFDDIADSLASEYTVATYDPRGMSRSTLDDLEAEQRVAEHADDAFRILELLSPGKPARVFGGSSGAITALHLLAEHPERVERVVAHEPPAVMVLPDAVDHRELIARVQKVLRTQGPVSAMAVFAAGLKKNGDTTESKVETELSPQALARAEQTTANLPYFLGRIVPSFMSYIPDINRLKTLLDQLVLAGGRDSPGELTYRPAALLAERLDTELLHFPGGHAGLTTHPAQFGEFLRQALCI